MKKIILGLFAITSINAQAAFYSSNEFLAKSEGFQLAFISGVIDAFIATKKPFFCIPDEVTAGQLNDISKKYLKDHPEVRHFTAASNIVVAVNGAFPCK